MTDSHRNRFPERLSDRERWNLKYRQSDAPQSPSAIVLDLEAYVPARGTAIDVAGGAGRHALWLAKRGLDVTLVDVSDVAIRLATEQAAASQLTLRTLRADLEVEPFPAGPWDLIFSTFYLHRPLFAAFSQQLRPGGTLIFVQPTLTNLQRHDKPPREYLLRSDEILQLASGLDVLYHHEGWSGEGRHDAVLVARRPHY